MSRRSDLPRLPRAVTDRLPDPADRLLLRRALVGLEPAEVLGPVGREAVIRLWHAAGRTDADMARTSSWSVHVVRRLRDRLELAPNPTTTDWRHTA